MLFPEPTTKTQDVSYIRCPMCKNVPFPWTHNKDPNDNHSENISSLKNHNVVLSCWAMRKILWFIDGSGGDNHCRRSTSSRFPINGVWISTRIRYEGHRNTHKRGRQHRPRSVVRSLLYDSSLIRRCSVQVATRKMNYAPPLISLVALNTCANTARSSPCSNLSNFNNASSISVRPASFLRNVSIQI